MAKASIANKPLALVAALAALVAVVGAVAFGESARERILLSFHVGYQERVSALLAEGKQVAALDELERASLVDASRFEMLKRMARLNKAARFGSPPMAQLSETVSGDTGLRFRIGEALAAQLGDATNLIESQRALLQRATENASALVALKPRSARSHYLMGVIHLLRGSDTGSSSELSSATSSLERALSLDPDYSGARRALEEARDRSGH